MDVRDEDGIEVFELLESERLGAAEHDDPVPQQRIGQHRNGARRGQVAGLSLRTLRLSLSSSDIGAFRLMLFGGMGEGNHFA